MPTLLREVNRSIKTRQRETFEVYYCSEMDEMKKWKNEKRA